jgi:predicted transcriptional regulator
MPATTTIRVDRETHARLADLSAARGRTLMETVRDAAEALSRQQFARQVSAELASLRQSPSEWAEYLAEAEATAVTDGVD